MIKKIDGLAMNIHPESYIAENAALVGEISLEKDASVWYGAVLRGDSGAISVGERSCIEDNAVIHGHTAVGRDVIVGHCAILHSCKIEDGCLIGMGATVMDDAHIGSGSLIAAGCLVPKGTVVPPNSLVMGVPAQVIQATSREQKEYICHGPKTYLELARLQLPQYCCLMQNNNLDKGGFYGIGNCRQRKGWPNDDK